MTILLSTDTDKSISHDAIGAQLDITALKSQRRLQAATILSSRHTKATLDRLRASHKPMLTSAPSDTDPLLSASSAQLAHNQENLYRACSGITSFRIRDPDPNAVDGGNVLGIRIDVSATGKFIRPYYIMLNKPWPGSDHLRIHRHTVPPSIPLAALADLYLPHGKGSVAMVVKNGAGKKQDLRRLVRALRREIVGYHNRITIIKRLRSDFKLDEKVSKKGKGRERVIINISAADAEAKQVMIEWVDGRIGRAVVNERGEVVKCVVVGEEGRDREVERRLVGGSMEGIRERLLDGMY
ncbi:cenp-O kinetochore centromere component [Diplocarpon rosae]|nr:cenp-O kinetochore centromere component [Diplocarpon rosae]